ncbi:aminoacyl-tRNA hydrolase [Candidatus Falkowbacteria bacterium CG10_big_fil_rev_8_21_14_0_10_43_10]|uniref:Peptidyl-tRNA hydrolase n=1 Tax=Candidatus Falkowbacteria bacterium CG10_big_fil_rev_8_21_14_0_10_43_10 TaxID=1974567 RepID=A0A2H0V207_9BACT|nr:MAG: aminoacyl-tRNA hydrolase [Candidatus Falkowbacteria bacterium CG10_big_fil_rev_8_21_14_0_10_43_10]
MKIIVGLGNPDPKYKFTRHNAGFIILDKMAEERGAGWQFNKKFNALTARAEDAILIKPQTYMNNSGLAVRAALDYYKLLPKKLGWLARKNANLADALIVVHDDVDIELGKFKAQPDRSSAGHRGVQSIINQLKTQNFTRVRVGIAGEQLEKIGTEKFVLQKFSAAEADKLKKIIPEIIKNIAKK